MKVHSGEPVVILWTRDPEKLSMGELLRHKHSLCIEQMCDSPSGIYRACAWDSSTWPNPIFQASEHNGRAEMRCVHGPLVITEYMLMKSYFLAFHQHS